MNAIARTARDWAGETLDGWNRFWFTPSQPHTLALIRILGGSMLLYTHFVWSLDLIAFFGPDAWITADTIRELHRGSTAWSYLWYVESSGLLWTLHIMALAVIAMFTLGLFTRVTSVLTWLITLAYCHRMHGALFGLDQVNAMIAMYCMLGPCGAVYSLDAWRRKRSSRERDQASQASVAANVAIRLLQLHMCVIYLFGGIAKMRGVMWWDGNATWFAVSNLEYQSIDMTWLVHYPILIALLTHVTVFWETFYCALVWPRATRPIVLFLAVCVHGGIALFLGMITFGLAMIIGNLAFVSPAVTQSIADRSTRIRRGAGQGSHAKNAKTKSETSHRT